MDATDTDFGFENRGRHKISSISFSFLSRTPAYPNCATCKKASSSLHHATLRYHTSVTKQKKPIQALQVRSTYRPYVYTSLAAGYDRPRRRLWTRETKARRRSSDLLVCLTIGRCVFPYTPARCHMDNASSDQGYLQKEKRKKRKKNKG